MPVRFVPPLGALPFLLCGRYTLALLPTLSHVSAEQSRKGPAGPRGLRYTVVREGKPTQRRGARSLCSCRRGVVPVWPHRCSLRGVMDISQSVPVAYVLIANPVLNLRQGLRYVARLLGCAVTEASTCEEVLAQLADTPDIVVV